MRRSLMIVAPLAMFALAAPALAGGPECEKNAKSAAMAASSKGCTASKEECAKYMASAKTSGWLGIQYDKTESGNSVIKDVVPGSPAEAAGFKAGDVLYAINGVEINDANKDRLKAMKGTFKPGASVNYTVKRSGYDKSLTATLGTMPDAVYQAMVDEHAKEHATVATR